MLLSLAALLLAPQAECTASDQDSWLTPIRAEPGEIRHIHAQRVFAVLDNKVAVAIAQVSRLPFVPLTDSEAQALTGIAATTPGVVASAIVKAPETALDDGFASAEEAAEQARALRGKLSPWLVRAVYPTPNSSASASWFGDTLSISAGGMGCALYARHPVVVWLEKMPHRISVEAMAIR